jgi:predicted RNA binding protein YcfA (HicA-like mRNA interferase family)
MHKFPAIKGNELKRFCEKLGFRAVRQKGSHVRRKVPGKNLAFVINWVVLNK